MIGDPFADSTLSKEIQSSREKAMMGKVTNFQQAVHPPEGYVSCMQSRWRYLTSSNPEIFHDIAVPENYNTAHGDLLHKTCILGVMLGSMLEIGLEVVIGIFREEPSAASSRGRGSPR